MTFGEFVKSKRIESRMTLREFCRQFQETDPSNWSKVERGVMPPPDTWFFFERLSKLLKLSDEETAHAKDLAEISRGKLPADLQTPEILAKLPLIFMALRNPAFTPDEFEAMLRAVSKLHTAK